jgi:hypothetical protein
MGASDHTFARECAVASQPGLIRASTSLLAPSFRDTGHLVFLKAPDKYRELVLGFLGR